MCSETYDCEIAPLICNLVRRTSTGGNCIRECLQDRRKGAIPVRRTVAVKSSDRQLLNDHIFCFVHCGEDIDNPVMIGWETFPTTLADRITLGKGMSRSEALRYFPTIYKCAYLIAIIINLFVLYQEGGFRESTPYLICVVVLVVNTSSWLLFFAINESVRRIGALGGVLVILLGGCILVALCLL